MNSNTENIKWSQLIQERTSTRTYQPDQLSEVDRNNILNFAASLQGPFLPSFRFEIISLNCLPKATNLKLGTYGVIRGAQDYIAGIVQRGEKDLEQLGYTFQQLILYATSLQLGTCWLGGTYNKKQVKGLVEISSNEFIPVLSPIGKKAPKESLLSQGMKWSAKSKSRKSWADLFFDEQMDQPLSKENAGAFAFPLEMLRLAPSASNRQPWRIIKLNQAWHFYLKESAVTTKVIGFPLQRIDMGIAMCHFELSAREAGLAGYWKVDNEKPLVQGSEKLHYTVSWKY